MVGICKVTGLGQFGRVTGIQDQQLLTNHVEVTQSGLGSGSVDLTHILTLIRPLHVSNQITEDKNISEHFLSLSPYLICKFHTL